LLTVADRNWQEVVAKVNAAQERRVDNMISRLDDSTRVLQMYAWVCTAVRKQVLMCSLLCACVCVCARARVRVRVRVRVHV